MTIEHGAIGDLSINLLDQVMDDPHIRVIMDKAKAYNNLLSSQKVTEDEVSEIISELDTDWEPFINKVATITANMRFAGDGTAPFTEMYYDHEAISNGFIPARLDADMTDNDEDTPDGTQITHPYEIRLQFHYEKINADAERVFSYGSAALDDIYKLEFDEVMTVERARAWLSYYYAEVIDEIDVALLNSATDECEMVMMLSESMYDLSMTGSLRDDDDEKTKEALNMYTDSLFVFDQEMPYQISVDGRIWVVDDDERILRPGKVEGTTFTQVKRMVWDNSPGDEDFQLSPHIELVTITNDKDEPGGHLIVPLSSVTNLQSLRRMHFGPLE
jgi:hypothetical protein